MSGIKLEIDNKELIKLNKQFLLIAEKVNKEGSNGLEKAGAQIGEDAQWTLKRNDNIATAQLINSLKIKKETDGGIKVEFEAKHAANIEFGQKSGTKVSVKALIQWVKKKGLTNVITRTGKKLRSGKRVEEAALGIAIAVANSIEKRGTKARPFLYPAFRKNEQEVIKVIGDSIKKVL